MAVALSWIILSITGALPFIISGSIPHPIDAILKPYPGSQPPVPAFLRMWKFFLRALFSGEASPTGSAAWEFWCSAFPSASGRRLSYEPDAGGKSRTFCKQTGPQSTVHSLNPVYIYFGMTVMQIIFLLIGRMPLFDALCITFGSAERAVSV